MFAIIQSRLPPHWVDFFSALSLADIIAGIPAIIVIYTVIPSALFTMRHRSSKGNWYIPPEPNDESPAMHAKLLILRSLAFMFAIKYIAQYIFNHPPPEVFVSGAMLTVALITVNIYHYENRGIVKPAIPLSILWGIATITTLIYTTKAHDVSHEIYLVSSMLMFVLELASPRAARLPKADRRPPLKDAHKPLSDQEVTTIDHTKAD
ncbi:8575_t:CDS:2 [Ambispora leptoticha]|uniref:8575_t:CDS:1 n=1 Tax=Ambispora leptoticha TaxID=144679 RepID=A0A9N9FRW4_9GLOM|nr:8575_t:CDS:2 [Ambispora leptoticha]